MTTITNGTTHGFTFRICNWKGAPRTVTPEPETWHYVVFKEHADPYGEEHDRFGSGASDREPRPSRLRQWKTTSPESWGTT